MRRILMALAVFGLFTSFASVRAEDAVKADPKHYKVEFENDRVRVLRINSALTRSPRCTPTRQTSPYS